MLITLQIKNRFFSKKQNNPPKTVHFFYIPANENPHEECGDGYQEP